MHENAFIVVCLETEIIHSYKLPTYLSQNTIIALRSR